VTRSPLGGVLGDVTVRRGDEISIRSHAGRFGRPLVVIALLVAASLPAGTAAAARTVKVGAAANGKSLELKPGDTLAVRLAANPTTGYDWAVACKPKALELVKRTYLASPPLRIGQGGTDVFRFSVRSGRGRLELVYRRSWEKAKAPLRTFLLGIRAS
jgi:inhibitor of cysteine peptidase